MIEFNGKLSDNCLKAKTIRIIRKAERTDWYEWSAQEADRWFRIEALRAGVPADQCERVAIMAMSAMVGLY